MNETEQEWSVCNLLASHHYWHKALYYLERGETDAVVEIMDSKLMKNLSSLIDVINTSSLLMRLKFNNETDIGGESMRERWNTIKSHCLTRVDTHGYIYSDSHIALTFAACGTDEEKAIFLNSLDKYLLNEEEQSSKIEEVKVEGLIGEYELLKRETSGRCFLKDLNAELKGLFEAIFAYERNEFDQCVERLYPIRHRVKAIGGSNAQRDLFGLMLIDAAFKSSVATHRSLAVQLLNERLMAKPTSQLTKRLAERFFINE
jgi:hypothetical protein